MCRLCAGTDPELILHTCCTIRSKSQLDPEPPHHRPRPLPIIVLVALHQSVVCPPMHALRLFREVIALLLGIEALDDLEHWSAWRDRLSSSIASNSDRDNSGDRLPRSLSQATTCVALH